MKYRQGCRFCSSRLSELCLDGRRPVGVGSLKLTWAVHARRGARQYATTSQTGTGYLDADDHVKGGPRPKRKERLVILGSGWGAMSLLKSLDQQRYEVFVVSPNTYFAMTPLLAQAATGALELRATMEPVRGNHKVQFYHAWVESIHLEDKYLTLMPAYPPAFRQSVPPMNETGQIPSVHSRPQRYPNTRGGHGVIMTNAPHRRAIESHDEDETRRQSMEGGHHSHEKGETWHSMEHGRDYKMPFDRLVISVGAYNRTFSTPGVREHAWFLKDAANARAIRWRILECMEQADHPDLSEEEKRQLLNFLVVGGGPTGAEFAAELHDLLRTDLKRLFPRIAPLASISIIDASGGILNNFDASLATFARQKFQRDGIKLLLNRKVMAVKQGRLVCEPDGEIPFGLLVWSTGICAAPLVKKTAGIAKDANNSFFLTDDQLRVLASPDNSVNLSTTSSSHEADKRTAVDADSALSPIPGIYAIGDCAQIRGKILPATAQVASQKGKHLAMVLNGQASDDASDGELIFKHRDMGAMASLGSGSAIVDSPNAKAQGRVSTPQNENL